jgi:hypothetical protein
MATVYFSGYVFQDDGDAVNGATVELLQVSDGAQEASTTTNSSGFWSFDETDEDRYDIKITSGTSIRYRKWADEISLKAIDVRNNEGEATPAAVISNIANGDDMEVAHFRGLRGTGVNDDNLFFRYYMDDGGSNITEVARMTVNLVDATHNSEDAKIVWSVIGNASLLNVFEISSTGLTVGVDDTGYDVKFFGASAGAYLIYDQSEDQLEIRGPSADATTSTGKILLSTALTNINASDVIGKIDFKAPLESGGTDAILVGASIQAVAQSTFAADSNATDLLFMTGHSEAAAEKFRITSQGELGVGGANYGSSGQVLTSGGAGAAPSWATPTTGDITGVTAGDGLSGGGTSGGVTLALDLNELTGATLADGDSLVFIDANDSNGSRKEALADVLDLIAGTVATTGLDRSGATLVVTDLHPVGVSGANNQLITDDGDGTVTSESNLTFTGSVLTVTGSVDTTLDQHFDSSPSDNTVSGITATFTAGEDLDRGEVVYFKASDSKMWKAVASATGTMPVVAMAAEDIDISSEATGKFLLYGFLADNGTFPAYTVGGTLYAPEAETSSQNVPEQAAPDTDGDFVQVLGYAVTANSVFFNPSNDVIEHA